MIYKIALFLLMIISVVSHHGTGDDSYRLAGIICGTGLCVILAIEECIEKHIKTMRNL